MSTGWTYDQVGEQFDLPRLRAMNEYWAGSPPVHVAVARYLGYKPKEKAGASTDDLLAALQAFQ